MPDLACTSVNCHRLAAFGVFLSCAQGACTLSIPTYGRKCTKVALDGTGINNASKVFFLSRELQIHQHSKMYSLTVLVWSMSRMDLLCWAFLYIISTDLHTPNVVVVVVVGGDCIVRKKWCIDIQVMSRESNGRVCLCPLKH